MLTIDPTKVTMILIQGAGWENVVLGSFAIDTIQLAPPSEAPEAEDYGFVAVHDSGDQIMGRMSALLAVRRAAR